MYIMKDRFHARLSVERNLLVRLSETLLKIDLLVEYSVTLVHHSEMMFESVTT